MTVDKSAIRSDLDKAWKDLSSLVDSIPERELLQPGVVEEWSVKDLFGHMAFWANKAATDLEALTTGAERKIETPGSEKAVDEWNAREAAASAGKSLGELRKDWKASFEAARSALDSTPVDRLELEVKGFPQVKRFLGDTTEHYREHEEQIRDWLTRLETTEE